MKDWVDIEPPTPDPDYTERWAAVRQFCMSDEEFRESLRRAFRPTLRTILQLAKHTPSLRYRARMRRWMERTARHSRVRRRF